MVIGHPFLGTSSKIAINCFDRQVITFCFFKVFKIIQAVLGEPLLWKIIKSVNLNENIESLKLELLDANKIEKVNLFLNFVIL